jgi:hypothetical protein
MRIAPIFFARGINVNRRRLPAHSLATDGILEGFRERFTAYSIFIHQIPRVELLNISLHKFQRRIISLQQVPFTLRSQSEFFNFLRRFMMEIWAHRRRLDGLAIKLGAILLLGLVGATASAGDGGFGEFFFFPGNLVVTRSVYDNNPNNLVVGVTALPPNCSAASGSCTTPPTTAITDATYPQVFNNDSVDGSFGITSKIFLDQITPFGFPIGTLEVPDSPQFGFGFGDNRDHLVTSFSSKSELAVNLSTDRKYLTFMGYVASPNTIDVSNANTPGVVDPTNPVGENYYRAVAKVDQIGQFNFTETNAYSGDNGRAAILNDGANVIYASGNAGNGNNPQPNGVILGAGAQILFPSLKPEFLQDPGTPTPVGSFNITQLGDKADKIGKDTNFRGLSIFNNVVYYTKGSGSNGVNTVYFIDTTGTACPNGVGVPSSSATLPTTGINYNEADLQTEGVVPYNMCILNGFNTALAKKTTNVFPFGVWFANATTLYVADEGDGTNTYSTTSGTYTDAASQTLAGLQKWTFNGTTWTLAYTLQKGLGLGTPYTVPGYPTGNNTAPGGTGLPWAPATDGLRNLTGIVNRDGSATIYAITSTVSGGGDQGADPNKLVAITDNLAATTLPSSESFHTIKSAGFGEVLRGVSWTPGQFPGF